MNEITFRKEVDVTISPQAQKVLAGTKYSIDDFKKWALEDQKISLGGHNAVLFLEAMYNDDKQVRGD